MTHDALSDLKPLLDKIELALSGRCMHTFTDETGDCADCGARPEEIRRDDEAVIEVQKPTSRRGRRIYER